MRRAWGFNGGGPGSGIYKTTDAGATWIELRNGDCRVATRVASGSRSRRRIRSVLNALVESPETNAQGTYRTENGGDTWERVSQRNGRPDVLLAHLHRSER